MERRLHTVAIYSSLALIAAVVFGVILDLVKIPVFASVKIE